VVSARWLLAGWISVVCLLLGGGWRLAGWWPLAAGCHVGGERRFYPIGPTITYMVNEGLPTAFLQGRSLVETDEYLSCNMTCIRDDDLSLEPQDLRGSSLKEMAMLKISLLVARH